MGRTWWLLLNALAVGVVYAAPRELTTDELITKPRPGEEYVHIQTSSQDKIDLVDKSFTTSHRIPELSKTNRSQDFQTSHKIPSRLERTGRSLSPSEESEQSKQYDGPEPSKRVVFTVSEGTTNEPPLERVVTRTSIKMSKSKKVQKSVVKVAHDDLVDIKADEGLIDERSKADEEEKEIMKKKFLKSEKVESSLEEFSLPTRFNVPFEDEEKEINLDPAHLIIPNPVIATTQEPPITTFNYKNVYDKTRKSKGFVTGGEKPDERYKYETVVNESIKTAESKAITSKKDTKQEKKDKYAAKEKEESGFYVLPVNKQQKFKEDNYDFVDVEEKILVPAGSSPSQSSRINIKKGPNGQEYEYEYVYYYYDDDEEGGNGGTAPKEGKVVASTTEKIYNGHDGPTKEDQEQNSVQGTSTSGSKYLPTEAPKLISKGKAKTQIEVTEKIEDDVPAQNFVSKTSRGGSTGGSRFSQSGRQSELNRQQEPATNEVYPSSARSQARSRGRGSSNAAVQEEDIPSIGEERLPANTRFPPRSRANAPVTSPQPQETTARSRGREGSNQSRLRIPNLGLLDSSSFRTHASDASIEDDASLRDAELQRKANARGQATEPSHRRGTRPTTHVSVDTQDVPAVTRRPAIRKPVEERRPRPSTEEDEGAVEEKRYKVAQEESERVLKVPQEEEEVVEKRPRVPLEEEIVRAPKVPFEEEQEVRRPQVPLEEEVAYQEEQRQKEVPSEAPQPEEIRPQPQTTRESDAEEGVFENAQGAVGNTSGQSVTDQSGSSEVRASSSATEDPSVPGLTSAMMEKVALDLYAILQQAQNENIRTNFIDGNSTDVTTDLGEGQTEFSNDGSTAEPSTTTTTTTTTTTPAPTTTTTTTTTPPPTQAPGRGRYRGRVAGASKGRTKVSTTTTTEPPEEVTSPKTRGRFQPGHGTRGSGLSFSRKPTKPAVKEPAPEEAPANEETPRASPERAFGERPRSRFRTSGKVTTSAPSTAAPTAPASGTAPAAGVRGSSADRFNSRRRGGGRTTLPATQHSTAEAQGEEERQEIHQETPGAEEATPSTPLRPTRPRIGGSVRPLRPGPRAPLILPQRGHQAAAANTSPLPAEHEEVEKEVVETEVHAQQPNEEVHEGQTTPVGDALTRLKSRPRLRIGANPNHQRPQTPPPPPQNRRKLVSSLLPKRKPNEEKPVEKVEETEERIVQEEIPVEEELSSAPVEPSSTTAEPEAKGLSGLLAGRRRNLNRRPGTIYSRAQPAEA